MTRYKYGGLDTKGIYLDETVLRMCYTHRRLFASLATHLIQEGQNDKALKALDYCEKVIPSYNVPHNYVSAISGSLDIAKSYALLGQKQKARKILDEIFKDAHQYVAFYFSLGNSTMAYQEDIIRCIYIMNYCVENAEMVDKAYAGQLEKTLQSDMSSYQKRGGQLSF